MDNIIASLKDSLTTKNREQSEEEKEFDQLFDKYNMLSNKREIERTNILAENKDLIREMTVDVKSILSNTEEALKKNVEIKSRTAELKTKFEECKRLSELDTNGLVLQLENDICQVLDIKEWEESTNKELTEIEYFIKFL